MRKYLFFLLLPALTSCDKSDGLLRPEITTFNPTSGSVGTTVTITGNNFSATPSDNTVTFNGAQAHIISASASSLKVMVPAQATTGRISVSVKGQTTTSVSDFVLLPTLIDFIPQSGTKGSVVLVQGGGFSGAPSENLVSINGVPAVVTLATSTQLVVVVPSNATSGKISVSTGGHTFESVATFTLVPYPAVATLAGSERGYLDGTGSEAKFFEIFGMVADAEGNIYVSDPATNRIRKITPEGVVTTFAGVSPGGHADGPVQEAMFKKPTGMAADAQGNLYVADYGNHRIRKIDPSGMVTTVAGTGVSGNADGPANTAEFTHPRCVTLDKDGNIYVGETYRIRKITPGGMVSTFAGSDKRGYADGTGTAAKFDSIADIKFDGKEYLYAADFFNSSIRKISLQGMVTTYAGRGVQGYAEGLSSEALFDHPTGIAIDAEGGVLVADTKNYRIRKIVPGGLLVNTIAGNGTRDYVDGDGDAASFSKPNALIIAGGNTIIVADNCVIRKITVQP